MAIIAPLFSSSKGNATFVGNKEQGVLIDCGCSLKALKRSLELCDITLDAVKAVVITHEHSDHIKALPQLSKHTRIPIYASDDTMEWLISHREVSSATCIYSTKELASVPLDMDISTFSTPHDCVGSVGYVIRTKQMSFAYCTDLGIVTEEVEKSVLGCDAVLLESNYDSRMLSNNSKYPYYLKKRIASDRGHLSNTDSATFSRQLVENGTTRIILGHLSQENNTPEIAAEKTISMLSQFGLQENLDYTLNIAPVNTNGKYIAL